MSEEDPDNLILKFSQLALGPPNPMEAILRALVAAQQAQMQVSSALVEEQKKANLLKEEDLQLQRLMAAGTSDQ